MEYKEMTRLQILEDAWRHGNVRAGARVVREGESGQGDDAYRMRYHPTERTYFQGFAKHPRIFEPTPTGERSSAAGAYQITWTTWQDLVAAWGFSDFLPHTQDLAFVALCIRRKALEALIAGRFERWVELCGNEWASLPRSGLRDGGSKMSFARARAVFAEWGGIAGAPAPVTPAQVQPVGTGTARLEPAPWPFPTGDGDPHGAAAADWDERSVPAPASTLRLEPDPAAQNALGGAIGAADISTHQPTGKNAPMPPFAIPVILEVIRASPTLARLFGSGSPTAERNAKALEIVADVAKEVTGAVNEQAAAEALAADPALRAKFELAAQQRYYDLTEAGAGGIEGARAQLERMTGGLGSMQGWRALGFGAVIGGLSLAIVVGGGAMVWHLLTDPGTSDEQRGLLIGALIATVSAVVSFWFGSAASSRTKDSTIERLSQR